MTLMANSEWRIILCRIFSRSFSDLKNTRIFSDLFQTYERTKYSRSENFFWCLHSRPNLRWPRTPPCWPARPRPAPPVPWTSAGRGIVWAASVGFARLPTICSACRVERPASAGWLCWRNAFHWSSFCRDRWRPWSSSVDRRFPPGRIQMQSKVVTTYIEPLQGIFVITYFHCNVAPL